MGVAPLFEGFDRFHLAGAYWHWYFLSPPEPFPERMIGADPDSFFETCFETWNKMPIGKVDPVLLAEYRGL